MTLEEFNTHMDEFIGLMVEGGKLVEFKSFHYLVVGPSVVDERKDALSGCRLGSVAYAVSGPLSSGRYSRDDCLKMINRNAFLKTMVVCPIVDKTPVPVHTALDYIAFACMSDLDRTIEELKKLKPVL